MTARKDLLRLGGRGRALVRVVAQAKRGEDEIAVLWTDGTRKARAFPKTKDGRAEAVAFAEGVHAKLKARGTETAPAAAPLTVEQLFGAFAESEFAELRPNSQRLYREHWATWQAFVGPHTVAQDCGRANMVSLRALLQHPKRLPKPYAATTFAALVTAVKRVYRWADEHERIARADVLKYRFKIAKDARPAKRAEYRADELEAVLAALPLTDAGSWRAHVVLALAGYQGVRQHAARHLRWDDIDLAAGTIRWVPTWDKLGRDRVQPMRAPVRAMLEQLVALGRQTSEWVVPAVQGRNRQAVYSIQSVYVRLRAAERALGIAHKPGRGGHGFRKLLAGEVAALSGNVKLALNAIGDTDMRQAEVYVLERDDQMRAAFDGLDAARASATEVQPEADTASITGDSTDA
jgi:integrase